MFSHAFNRRTRILFQQDGAEPQIYNNVKAYLNRKCKNYSIGK